MKINKGGIHDYVIIYGKNVIPGSLFCFYGQKESQAVLTVVPYGLEGGASLHAF